MNHLAARVAAVDYDGAAALAAYQNQRPSNESTERAFIERHCPNLPEGIGRINDFLTMCREAILRKDSLVHISNRPRPAERL